MRAEKFQLEQIPHALLDDPFAETRAFSTVFIVNGKIAGSGTFVSLNGIAGILTAHHMWDLVVDILSRTRIRWKGGFDCWELKTLSRKGGKPESSGGMSGSGVWKIILQKKRGAKLSTAKVLGVYLGGVALYQSALKGNWRFLRAHGPNTIYRKLRALNGNEIGSSA